MKIIINVYPSGDFSSVLSKLDEIMTTQVEAAVEIAEVTAKVTKIGTETSTLLAKIQELIDQINNAGQDISPEVQQAITDLQVQAQIVDDLVPDAQP